MHIEICLAFAMVLLNFMEAARKITLELQFLLKTFPRIYNSKLTQRNGHFFFVTESHKLQW